MEEESSLRFQPIRSSSSSVGSNRRSVSQEEQSFQTVKSTKAYGKMKRCMDSVSTSGQMERSTKGHLRKASDKAKESIPMQTGMSMMVIGDRVRDMV
jgi:hypothetical protein